MPEVPQLVSGSAQSVTYSLNRVFLKVGCVASSAGGSPVVTLCDCETAWVSKLGVLEVTWGFRVFWQDPAGASQEY